MDAAFQVAMAVFAPYILPQERGGGRRRRRLDVQRAQELVDGAGIVVMVLWTRSILLALEESAAAAAAAPVGVGEVVYLLFVYAMWLLSLTSLLLPHLRLFPEPDVGYVMAIAALVTSVLVWLVVWLCKFVDGLYGIGEWAWRSPGFCFLVLVFLRALHLAVP